MVRSSYLQRLAVRGPADPASVLTPARLLFPPRLQLPEQALPTLRETSSAAELQRAGAVADAISAPASPNVSAMTPSAVSAAPTPATAALELQRAADYVSPSRRASGAATAVLPRRSSPEQLRAHVPETGAAAQRHAETNMFASASAARALRPGGGCAAGHACACGADAAATAPSAGGGCAAGRARARGADTATTAPPAGGGYAAGRARADTSAAPPATARACDRRFRRRAHRPLGGAHRAVAIAADADARKARHATLFAGAACAGLPQFRARPGLKR